MYLLENISISLDQSAYSLLHNMQTCFQRVVDDWLDNMKDNLLTGVCLLDIKKCYDSIDHAILPRKLTYYDIAGNKLNFFHIIFIREREQVVSVEGCV